LEIRFSQFQERFAVDLVLCEQRAIVPKIELLEPSINIDGRGRHITAQGALKTKSLRP
jgi:hypothetical protein